MGVVSGLRLDRPFGTFVPPLGGARSGAPDVGRPRNRYSEGLSTAACPVALQGRVRRPRIGKSHFFAELLVEECFREPGTLAVCIRETQKDAEKSAKR